MDRQPEGKRVAQGSSMSGGAKAAIAAAVAAAVLLVGGYTALSVYVSRSDTFLPNTAIAGVPVGGMTQTQAVQTLEQQLPARLAQLSAPFLCGGKEYAVSGSELVFDAAGAVRQAAQEQHGSLLSGGAQYLAALAGGAEYPVSLELNGTPAVVSQAAQAASDTEAHTTWELTGSGSLLFHKGRTGRTVDVQALNTALAQRFNALLAGDASGSGFIEAQITTAPPVDPDFQAIYDQVYVEAADAYLDPETKEIVPAVTGVSFDVDAAATALGHTEEGGDCIVPLQYATPGLSTEELTEKLFADVLATATTKCASPAARWHNIDLAASRCNGVILMPGEIFSYNDTAGPYTKSSGYRDAGTYQNGQSVDATAGGICQLSSTLYWATLRANLEIVERNKHQFHGGYMPVIGTDATVWSDQLDFRFKNNTQFPIKLECYQDNSHNLHVTILGTDTTGIHGEPYHVIISTVPYKNTYKADASKVPPGGEPVRDTNYSRYPGYTVDLYQKLVDKNGNTVDTIFLYRNTYKASNAVYYYNPADAAALGIDPATGLQTLTPVTPTPAPSPQPTPSPTGPDVTPPPDVPTPAVTPEPTPEPFVTPMVPTPAPTPEPAPEPTPQPDPGPGPGMEPEDVPPAAQSVPEE